MHTEKCPFICKGRKDCFLERSCNQSINTAYFHVLSATDGCIVIRSRNTGHLWAINGTGVGDGVKLMHKHKVSDSWHDQAFHIKGRHNLAGAYEAIRLHDEFYIQKKRRTEKHEERRQKSEGL